jgi:hypothetical protein
MTIDASAKPSLFRDLDLSPGAVPQQDADAWKIWRAAAGSRASLR